MLWAVDVSPIKRYLVTADDEEEALEGVVETMKRQGDEAYRWVNPESFTVRRLPEAPSGTRSEHPLPADEDM